MAFTIKHFSLAMPAGKGQGNVPELLRRLAKSIEEKGDIEIQDITFHVEFDDDYVDERRPDFTVYYYDK